MAVIVSVDEIWKFYEENRSHLREEYRLVAEDEESGVELYITEENGAPYFTVEIDSVVEYALAASSDDEIESIYRKLLTLYICEDDGEVHLSSEDAERVDEIQSATIEYLSVLLEANPFDYFDEGCIDEITSAFEEYLHDAYGYAVRHPFVDGDEVIQSPYSEEV